MEKENKEGDISEEDGGPTKTRVMVISRALTAIPPKPIRCKVLRPALSTRKSFKQKKCDMKNHRLTNGLHNFKRIVWKKKSKLHDLLTQVWSISQDLSGVK